MVQINSTGFCWAKTGPHPQKILSIIYGSILGDAHVEKRAGNCRVSFKQGSPNVQYLLHNWKIFSSYGYCSPDKPQLKITISKRNVVYHYIRFHTWTYTSFNFIHELFYNQNKKILPCYEVLYDIIDTLALATWIMDGGGKVRNSGILIHTNSFTLDEVKTLCRLLENKFSIPANPRVKNKEKSQWMIFIPKAGVGRVSELVAKHFSEDMLRKLKDS